MNYKNYIESVRQGFEDPREYQTKTRYCEICDIEENKTYFVNESCICQECYEETDKKKERVIDYFINNEEDEELRSRMGGNGEEFLEDRDANYDEIYKRISDNYNNEDIDQLFNEYLDEEEETKKEKEHENQIKRYLFYINFLIKENDKLKEIISKHKKL
tara:strand:+ start:863 stop:1342 length:480 start_codon:yes stop_codon:yes gene_type:complete